MSWFDRFFKERSPQPGVVFANAFELHWDDHSWAGTTVLPAWAGFKECLGPYASESSDKPSNGKVQLSVSSPGEADGITAPPSKAQERAFCFLRDNDALIRDKVVQAIFETYPEARASFIEFMGEDYEDLDQEMPELKSPSDLKRLMGLSTVHIVEVEKDGFAYVGFEFGCTWEEEHGLGVMTHKDRIITVGQAEQAFDARSLGSAEAG